MPVPATVFHQIPNRAREIIALLDASELEREEARRLGARFVFRYRVSQPCRSRLR